MLCRKRYIVRHGVYLYSMNIHTSFMLQISLSIMYAPF